MVDACLSSCPQLLRLVRKCGSDRDVRYLATPAHDYFFFSKSMGFSDTLKKLSMEMPTCRATIGEGTCTFIFQFLLQGHIIE